jgi:membrane fusion protein (multidrug efflux system)
LKNTFIGLSFLLLLFSCKQKKDQPAQNAKSSQSPPIVDVIIAGGSSITNNIEVNGTVIPGEMVSINPETSGRLTMLNLPDGGKVSQGAVLAKINDADLQATYSKTKVLLDMAQKTEQRLRKLLTINGINQADYDLALNQVNSYKADLSVTQAEIDKTIIKAPFSGVLGLRMISPGAYVTPATILSTLQQVDKVKIDFNVPEAYGNLIHRGASVIVQTNEGNINRKATIIAIDPQLNLTTRNLKVRALLEGTSINPGSFVKVILSNNSIGENNIMVPTNCIIPEATAKKVIVVKDGQGIFVDIETGYRSSGMVEVTKGLKTGDSIVVTGVLFVRPKSPVKVRSVKKLSDLVK